MQNVNESIPQVVEKRRICAAVPASRSTREFSSGDERPDGSLPPWAPIPLFLVAAATYRHAVARKNEAAGRASSDNGILETLKIPLLGSKREDGDDTKDKRSGGVIGGLKYVWGGFRDGITALGSAAFRRGRNPDDAQKGAGVVKLPKRKVVPQSESATAKSPEGKDKACCGEVCG
ncbi:MAG: hypothetical protein HC767_06510 [Akkermansiaceae bacterium]|nr:hypothetical protein [Akkermansiaceae bacterium]